MKKTWASRRLPVLAAALVACAAFADLIYFANGDIDEGHVTIDGDYVTVTTRDGKGYAGYHTSRVERVDYGKWIEDLNPELRARVRASKKTMDVSAKAKPMKAVKRALTKPRNVPGGFGELSLGTPKGVLTIIMVLGGVVLVIVAQVCYIIVIVDACRYSVTWGVLSLLFPPVLTIYLFTHYSGRTGRMFLLLMSPVLWILMFMLLISRY